MDYEVVLARAVLLPPRLALRSAHALGGAKGGGEAGDEGKDHWVPASLERNELWGCCRVSRPIMGGKSTDPLTVQCRVNRLKKWLRWRLFVLFGENRGG